MDVALRVMLVSIRDTLLIRATEKEDTLDEIGYRYLKAANSISAILERCDCHVCRSPCLSLVLIRVKRILVKHGERGYYLNKVEEKINQILENK